MPYGRAFLALMLIAGFAFGGTLLALTSYPHIETWMTSRGQGAGYLTRASGNARLKHTVENQASLIPPAPVSQNVWQGAPVPPLGGTIHVSEFTN